MHLEKLVLILSAVTCVLSSKFLDQEWKAWKAKHEKEYSSFREEVFRRKTWEETWQKVQNHNELASKGLSKYTMCMNKFADMTPEERTSKKCFHSNRKFTPQDHDHVQHHTTRALNIPDSVDWRESNCVAPVKNQGICGSCWAFATVGVFESINCIKNKELVEFSEQQLVDCDNRNGNDGCCGGFPERAMMYITAGGIMKAKDYEYLGMQSKCSYNPENAVMLNVTKYYMLPGEDNMAVSLALNGPISVAIDASYDFGLYCKGIFDGECTTRANHAVIIVGYGTEHDERSNEDVDYWIVRNSWGEDWGQDGYIKMRRNVNKCGIATEATSVDMTN